MNIVELAKACENHQLWLNDSTQGEIFDASNFHLKNHHFDRLDLRNIDFGGKDLEGCSFVGADLTDCTFKRANLQNTNFCGANLTRAIFKEARMKDMFIQGCILPYPVPEGELIAWSLPLQRDEIVKILIPKNAHRIRLFDNPKLGRTHTAIPLEIVNRNTKEKLKSTEWMNPYWDPKQIMRTVVDKECHCDNYNGDCRERWGAGFTFYFDEKDILEAR